MDMPRRETVGSVADRPQSWVWDPYSSTSEMTKKFDPTGKRSDYIRIRPSGVRTVQ